MQNNILTKMEGHKFASSFPSPQRENILISILKSPLLLIMFVLFTFTVSSFVFLSFINTAQISKDRGYERVGDTFYREGKYDEAISSWQKILDTNHKNHKNTGIINKIGIVYLKSNNIDEAYQYYSEKCRIYPKDLTLRYNLAIACFKKEDFERCREEIDRISELNPFFPRLHYLKGLIYEKKGDLAKAEAEYIEELNMNPGEMGAWHKIEQFERSRREVR